MELHLHLVGAVRISTLRELAIAKNYAMSQHNSEAEIEQIISVTNPSTLADFLSKVDKYLPLFVGDAKAIERIAYELCEDKAAQQVTYFEVRFSPHILSNTVKHMFAERPVEPDSSRAVSPRDVIKLVGKGLRRGQRVFRNTARMILSTVKSHSDWTAEVVDMAAKYSSEGIVGIAIDADLSAFTKAETESFRRAKEFGIHIAVQLPEDAPPANIAYAIQFLYAKRISHGYGVFQDAMVYDLCRQKNVHFETCPNLSLLTGAVKPNDRHPIITFVNDGANFSINTAYPTVAKSSIDQERRLLQQYGINDDDLCRSNFNSAGASFLPSDVKSSLVQVIEQLAKRHL